MKKIQAADGRVIISGAPEGSDALVLISWAKKAGRVLMVTADDVAMSKTANALRFFDPAIECLEFPAWDCLPYDRVSPNGDVLNQRIQVLARLQEKRAADCAQVVITTVSALLQRLPSREALSDRFMVVEKGEFSAPDTIVNFLSRNGYVRADTVVEPGEYASRGGILDIFPAGSEAPYRLDFFGDDVEAIRIFDSETQRTTGEAQAMRIIPVSEVFLDDESISRFRTRYREMFSVTGSDDALYESVSAGRRYIGMEHWLPLFHEKLETLLDYIGKAPVLLGYHADDARDARLDLIGEYFTARHDVSDGRLSSGGSAYHPVPADAMYLRAEEWDEILTLSPGGRFTPFDAPETIGSDNQPVIDAEGRSGRDFADARVQPDVELFDAVVSHIRELLSTRRRIIITAFSEGSRDRLQKVLTEHGLGNCQNADDWIHANTFGLSVPVLTVAGFERGFSTPELSLITEQDILGERLNRPQHKRVKAENIIADAASLNIGDLVVHVDHGIARFDGLLAIEVSGAAHDCLQLSYSGDDRLFLPVENIELISRYGSEDAGAQLDKLGGAAWQARKSRLKDRIREMADELIKVAAARELHGGARIVPNLGAYDEFCARFPYTETDDQFRAIQAVLDDMASGRNTDRLVCGDVGFGKTEVALRAAFAVALEGKQVAVVVPTTLLCRQHFKNFEERFNGFPVKVRQLSRLISTKDVKDTKQGMAEGTIDIVIGTHALLAKDIRFRDLGLLIIDEEQHFGVTHKERLKSLKADVHVLTLTATPIPRTLQLALSGVREMSLIATPPVDRLAVRTFVMPFDPVVVREAILRERYRGGQTFYVCPRIADLEKVEREIRELIPEITMNVVHGQMTPSALEDRITSFYDGGFDVLLSTNIIESGIDMPRVNTIIIHRADRFGLAQLYQLRGRVGRSKTRAYAYLTLSPSMKITASAEKRLEVMQTLDHLGAGFSLASHDLDIRGAGNLLGDEQTGHVREVGIELYQQMLEEAVAQARGLEREGDQDWSPQISVGVSVLIPEHYVADLPVRMGLYRRIATLNERSEIDALAAEMIDRFGSLPTEVENLLQTVIIKQYCRQAGIDKVDAGPKGAVIGFRNNEFANPAGLIDFIQKNSGTAKLRPDHKIIYKRIWDDDDTRLDGVRGLLKTVADIATAA